ncbi:MAG: tRNA uridine-5-carboxymethylaminomethyl(34) synthesis GTPase MnmE [Proteobacteria bacterium]|nr:tRNA uridine-5-carboxymethylaminomethyl(34) synthesis GTPase MnmE [Pseudomonadota bacterium]
MSNAPDYIKDTIVAAATPPGTGGVAVVRLSGPASDEICVCMTGSLPPPRKAVFAHIADASGREIDRGLVISFPAPNSFTGEAVVELHCHGGPLLVAAVIKAAIELGARHALPGEFSKRAYLNDKLDLAQAEAIADLIGSGTEQAARAALRSLTGVFSRSVDALQEQLTALRLHTEAALDFPEEEIDFLSDGALTKKADDTALAFKALLQGATIGRVLRDGFQMIIIGRPNVGKSSLLNLLSGQDSAIVTEVAGTTRDILREQINIDGLAVELIDTAGLRSDPDRIEAEGIRRAREAISRADAILWIQDASEANEETINELEPTIDDDTPVIIVRNKIDLTDDSAGDSGTPGMINLSARTGAGVEALRSEIRRLAGFKDLGEGAFTARRRHLRAIEAAMAHFESGRRALVDERAGEIFAEELRLAQLALGEITGEFSSDELLGKIFSEFCIGK